MYAEVACLVNESTVRCSQTHAASRPDSLLSTMQKIRGKFAVSQYSFNSYHPGAGASPQKVKTFSNVLKDKKYLKNQDVLKRQKNQTRFKGTIFQNQKFHFRDPKTIPFLGGQHQGGAQNITCRMIPTCNQKRLVRGGNAAMPFQKPKLRKM